MLLKPFELAGELGISVATIRRLAKQGKIPYLKIGGQYRFELDRVLSVLKRDRDEDTSGFDFSKFKLETRDKANPLLEKYFIPHYQSGEEVPKEYLDQQLEVTIEILGGNLWDLTIDFLLDIPSIPRYCTTAEGFGKSYHRYFAVLYGTWDAPCGIRLVECLGPVGGSLLEQHYRLYPEEFSVRQEREAMIGQKHRELAQAIEEWKITK